MFRRFGCHQDVSCWHQSCQVKMKVQLFQHSTQVPTLPSLNGSQSSSCLSAALCLTSALFASSCQPRQTSRFDRNWRCQSHNETKSISGASLSGFLFVLFTFLLLCHSNSNRPSIPVVQAQSVDKFCKSPSHSN